MRIKTTTNVIKTLIERLNLFHSFEMEKVDIAAEAVRIIELNKDETLELRPAGNQDYLYLIDGHMDIEMPEGNVSLVPCTDNDCKPLVLTEETNSFRLTAKQHSIACHVDRSKLDEIISLHEMIQMNGEHITANAALWHDIMLKDCPILHRLPLGYIEEIFSRMEVRNVKAGDEIITQGRHGNGFFIIRSGKAEVWQTGLSDDQSQHIDDYSVGDSFGNYALLTGQANSKTVRMKTDGEILVLSQEDFNKYFRDELVRTVNASIAKAMIEDEFKLLDVRYEEEYEESRIPGAQHIPLHELNNRINELDLTARYVVYCHSGNRSLVAAMKLAQHNIEAFSMDGGIRDWPYFTEGEYRQINDRRLSNVCRRGIRLVNSVN